jgi:hypothetical protein
MLLQPVSLRERFSYLTRHLGPVAIQWGHAKLLKSVRTVVRSSTLHVAWIVHDGRWESHR